MFLKEIQVWDRIYHSKKVKVYCSNKNHTIIIDSGLIFPFRLIKVIDFKVITLLGVCISMSQFSFKEQLAALQLQPAVTAKKPIRKKPKQANPDWLEKIKYGLELLKVYFPQCFGEGEYIRPLKTGIRQDLVKKLSTLDTIVITDKAYMVSSLSYYVNSIVYLKSVLVGRERVDLEGHTAGTVSAEEMEYSKKRLDIIKKKK